MELYWLFLIPAIAIAIFADKIDKAANANRKLKKWLIAICVIRLDVMCKTDSLLKDKQGSYVGIYEKMSKV